VQIHPGGFFNTLGRGCVESALESRKSAWGQIFAQIVLSLNEIAISASISSAPFPTNYFVASGII